MRLRIAVLIVLALGFVGGLAICRVGVLQTWEAWQSSDWRRVTGVVQSADTDYSTQASSQDDPVFRSKGIRQEVKTDVWSTRLTYAFDVDGRSYQGHRITNADVPGQNYSEVREQTNRYAPGTQVTVFIHPVDPTLSVLEPGVTFGAVGPLIIGAVLCFCMGATASWVMSKYFVSVINAFRQQSQR